MYHPEPARKRAEGGGDVPPPPAHLSDEASRTWRAVLSEWVLSAEEVLMLRGALESWDTYVEAHETVQREGAVVATGSGGPKRNPAALIARDSFRDYRSTIRELGVTSTSEE